MVCRRRLEEWNGVSAIKFRKFSGFRVEFSVSGKSGWEVGQVAVGKSGALKGRGADFAGPAG
jgi:hypothetical protein